MYSARSSLVYCKLNEVAMTVPSDPGRPGDRRAGEPTVAAMKFY